MIKRRIARTQDRRGRDSLVRTIRLRLDLSDWLDAAAAQMGVAANSLVIVSPWLVHRHASAWERPEDFDPTRFLDADGARRRDVAAVTAYLPFGAGQIGRAHV